MTDKAIIELLMERSEDAIKEIQKKYYNYCFSIANRILENQQDSEECVNDTYMQAWNTIPPHKPEVLSTFLGKITRNLALNQWKKKHAQKRNNGEVMLLLDELQNCIPDNDFAEERIDRMVFNDILNQFLESLSVKARVIFVKRYWHMYSIKEIAQEYHMGQSAVKMSLARSRKQLQQRLRKGGFYEK